MAEGIPEILAKCDEILAKFENLVIHSVCALCNGLGEIAPVTDGIPGTPLVCPQCGGDGSIKSGSINTTSDSSSYE